jgi:hypothetical protein
LCGADGLVGRGVGTDGLAQLRVLLLQPGHHILTAVHGRVVLCAGSHHRLSIAGSRVLSARSRSRKTSRRDTKIMPER